MIVRALPKTSHLFFIELQKQSHNREIKTDRAYEQLSAVLVVHILLCGGNASVAGLASSSRLSRAYKCHSCRDAAKPHRSMVTLSMSSTAL
eukprot:4596934-Amphidinium_carterae.1